MHFFTANSCLRFVCFVCFVLLQTSCHFINGRDSAETPTPIATINPTPTAQTFDFGVEQSSICGTLPAEPLTYNGQCLHNGSATNIPDDQCVAAMLAQAACTSDNGSLCIPGYEVNCQRTSFSAETNQLAPQSLCSGLTVNGIGYAKSSHTAYHISETCLQAPAGNQQIVTCDFMGQSIAVSAAFCARLTSCVEPRLSAELTQIDTVQNIPVYRYPSGPQALHVDLSCSERALPTSLHHPQNGCRAIDINVNENYGNLRELSRNAPVSTIPPAFVAIMEGCGIVWGGRYNGADGVPQGCDPMEFAFAPSCFEPN